MPCVRLEYSIFRHDTYVLQGTSTTHTCRWMAGIKECWVPFRTPQCVFVVSGYPFLLMALTEAQKESRQFGCPKHSNFHQPLLVPNLTRRDLRIWVLELWGTSAPGLTIFVPGFHYVSYRAGFVLWVLQVLCRAKPQVGPLLKPISRVDFRPKMETPRKCRTRLFHLGDPF